MATLCRNERLARQLALAHRVQHLLDSGEVESRADVARMTGVSLGRVSQVIDLMLLSPDILGDTSSASPCCVRSASRISDWRKQRYVVA